MAKVKKIYVESELVFEEKPSDPRFCDLGGQKFERLFVIGYAGDKRWFCRCDCGNITKTRSPYLKSGVSKSCGCYSREKLVKGNTKHGQARSGKQTKAYRTWKHILGRCCNPNNGSYKDYGGRGIKICDRWSDFENFLEDMGNPPSKKHSLDRINNDGDYCPENCRWATPIQQANNTRKNRFIQFNGISMTIAQWERHLGFKTGVLGSRIYRGWDFKKALTTLIKNKT